MSNKLIVLVLLACCYSIVAANTTWYDTTTTTTGLFPECPLDEVVHHYAFIGDCTKYWICFSNNRYLYMCPDTLWWHQEILTCDDPGDYCDNSTTATYPATTLIPTSTQLTTPGRDPRCSQGGASYWPEPDDCHKYVQCDEGESYVVSCPPNLYFSNQFKQCVRVDESECCVVNECRPQT